MDFYYYEFQGYSLFHPTIWNMFTRSIKGEQEGLELNNSVHVRYVILFICIVGHSWTCMHACV